MLGHILERVLIPLALKNSVIDPACLALGD